MRRRREEEEGEEEEVPFNVDRDRVPGIATRYGLDGPGIEPL